MLRIHLKAPLSQLFPFHRRRRLVRRAHKPIPSLVLEHQNIAAGKKRHIGGLLCQRVGILCRQLLMAHYDISDTAVLHRNAVGFQHRRKHPGQLPVHHIRVNHRFVNHRQISADLSRKQLGKSEFFNFPLIKPEHRLVVPVKFQHIPVQSGLSLLIQFISIRKIEKHFPGKRLFVIFRKAVQIVLVELCQSQLCLYALFVPWKILVFPASPADQHGTDSGKDLRILELGIKSCQYFKPKGPKFLFPVNHICRGQSRFLRQQSSSGSKIDHMGLKGLHIPQKLRFLRQNSAGFQKQEWAGGSLSELSAQICIDGGRAGGQLRIQTENHHI